MAIPADVQWEQPPYGARPVYLVGGNQGGPYALVYPDFIFATGLGSAAGTAVVYTPTPGKRWRIHYYRFNVNYVASRAGAPGGVTFTIFDGAVSTGIGHQLYLPGAAATGGGPPIYDSGWTFLGPGYLSRAPDNVLGLNISAALGSGVGNLIVALSEE